MLAQWKCVSPRVAGGEGQHMTADGRPVASRLAGWDEIRQLVSVLGEEQRGIFEIALDPASLDGPCRVVSGGGSLVISSGATIHGGGGFNAGPQNVSGIGRANNPFPVVNHGAIIADFAD